jgi:hypothetical protein
MSRLPDALQPSRDPGLLDFIRATDAATMACECRAKAVIMQRAGMFASAREMGRKQGHYEAMVLDIARRLTR